MVLHNITWITVQYMSFQGNKQEINIYTASEQRDKIKALRLMTTL